MGLLDIFSRAAAQPSEKDVIASLKAQAILQAKAKADGEGRQFTLRDYYDIANSPEFYKKFVEPKQKEHPNMGWNVRMTADLSGQMLDGIRIDKPSYDNLPGEFRDHLIVSGATIHNAVITPAHMYDVTRGAFLVKVTLDHMSADDPPLVITGTHHQDLTFTHIQGGHIKIDGHVEGITANNATMHLELGDKAVISKFNTEKTNFLSLDMKPGAKIVDSHFIGGTISADSKLHGGHFVNTNFNGVDLDGVSFNGATLQNVTFDASQMQGMDLSHAKIDNVTINGDIGKIKGLEQVHLVGKGKFTINGITVNNNNPQDMAKVLNRQSDSDVLKELAAKAAGAALGAGIQAFGHVDHHEFDSGVGTDKTTQPVKDLKAQQHAEYRPPVPLGGPKKA